MATTSVYGLRYQLVSDSPHGANLGLNLAEDVEDELVRIDAAIAAINEDSGLVSITPASGWSVNANGATVRKINKLVMARFDLNRDGANIAANVGSDLFTLDAAYRPPHVISFAGGGNISSGGTYGRFILNSGGLMVVQNHAGINTGHDVMCSAMWFVA